MENNSFLKGLKGGIPVCLGYIAVGFAFGIFAVASGLTPSAAILISMFNVTSAGQVAAVPIIVGGGTLFELALTQFIINLRYSLMSISLSQKMSNNITLLDRFVIAFVNTDEVFAVAMNTSGLLGRKFLYGLIITPFVGWTLGTLLGAFAGNILPPVLITALSMAIYGMFIAIIVPGMIKEKSTGYCVILAAAISCAFYFIPALKAIPSGFTIIICAVISAGVLAFAAPVKEGGADNE